MAFRGAVFSGILFTIVVVACSGGQDDFDRLPTRQDLLDLVRVASEEAGSFRIDGPGPPGNGSDPSEMTFEVVRPDRMRRTTVYRGDEDCPQLAVYIDGVEYRRIPCEQSAWQSRPMDAEDVEELERFYLSPESIVVAALDALAEPEVRRDETEHETNVIIVSGVVDYGQFLSYFPQFEAEDEGTMTPQASTAEITLYANSYLPLKLTFADPNGEATTYRFSEYDRVPPIDVPNPVTPLP